MEMTHFIENKSTALYNKSNLLTIHKLHIMVRWYTNSDIISAAREGKTYGRSYQQNQELWR